MRESDTIYREYRRRVGRVQLAQGIIEAVGLVGFVVTMGMLLWIFSGH